MRCGSRPLIVTKPNLFLPNLTFGRVVWTFQLCEKPDTSTLRLQFLLLERQALSPTPSCKATKTSTMARLVQSVLPPQEPSIIRISGPVLRTALISRFWPPSLTTFALLTLPILGLPVNTLVQPDFLQKPKNTRKKETARRQWKHSQRWGHTCSTLRRKSAPTSRQRSWRKPWALIPRQSFVRSELLHTSRHHRTHPKGWILLPACYIFGWSFHPQQAVQVGQQHHARDAGGFVWRRDIDEGAVAEQAAADGML
jgi:hypothetical protein